MLFDLLLEKMNKNERMKMMDHRVDDIFTEDYFLLSKECIENKELENVYKRIVDLESYLQSFYKHSQRNWDKTLCETDRKKIILINRDESIIFKKIHFNRISISYILSEDNVPANIYSYINEQYVNEKDLYAFLDKLKLFLLYLYYSVKDYADYNSYLKNKVELSVKKLLVGTRVDLGLIRIIPKRFFQKFNTKYPTYEEKLDRLKQYIDEFYSSNDHGSKNVKFRRFKIMYYYTTKFNTYKEYLLNRINGAGRRILNTAFLKKETYEEFLSKNYTDTELYRNLETAVDMIWKSVPGTRKHYLAFYKFYIIHQRFKDYDEYYNKYIAKKLANEFKDFAKE
jgi:hypothetical protein